MSFEDLCDQLGDQLGDKLVLVIRDCVTRSTEPLLARIAALEKERYIERTMIARLERRLDQRDEEVKAKRLEFEDDD